MDYVPHDVVVGPTATRTIRLFVRTPESPSFTYVGRLHGAHVLKRVLTGAAGNHGEALFDLTPTLPSTVWTQLGGLEPDEQNYADLDASLDRLRQPTTTEQRLQILRQFVEVWHGPVRPDEGLDESELPEISIPDVLRWWYRWTGRRTGILTGNNTLLQPPQLIEKSGKLVFYGENQWVYEWGTLAAGDDPPVFGRYDEADPWEPENITLSEHLIIAAIFEAVCRAPYGASAAWLAEEALAQIASHLPPIGINPWGWLGPTQFYGRNGVFMYSMKNGVYEGNQGYSVWIGAKTEIPLQFLRPFLGNEWEFVAL